MTDTDTLTAGRSARRPAVRRVGRKWLQIGLVHRAGGGALHRLHPRPGRPGRSLQLLRLVGTRAAHRLRRPGQLPRGVRGSVLQAGDEAQRDPGRALGPPPAPAGARGRAAPQPAASRTQRAASDLLRSLRALRGDHGDRLLADPPAGRARGRDPGRRRPRRARPPLARRASRSSSTRSSSSSPGSTSASRSSCSSPGSRASRASCTRRRRSTARPAGRRCATSRCRCSDRRSGSGRSWRSSGRSSSSTSFGS